MLLRRAECRAVLVGIVVVSFVHGCSHGKQADSARVATFETESLSVELHSDRVHESYSGPGCTPAGGGRGSVGNPTWKTEDAWRYELRIEAKNKAGASVRVLAPEARRRDYGGKPVEEPFAHPDVCFAAKDDRLAYRTGEDAKGWTVGYAFDTALVVSHVEIEATDCAAALASMLDRDSFLAHSLETSDDDASAAFVVAMAEKRASRAAIDHSLRGTTVTDASAGKPLLDAVAHDEVLAAHVLARLAPVAVAPALDEAGIVWAEALVDAIPDEERKRAAAKSAFDACRAPSALVECSELRLSAFAHVAVGLRDTQLCDAGIGLVPVLVREVPLHAEARALRLIESAGSCASEKALRVAMKAGLGFAAPAPQGTCDLSLCGSKDAGASPCSSVAGSAALWLAAHCDPATAALARALVDKPAAGEVLDSARCVVKSCPR